MGKPSGLITFFGCVSHLLEIGTIKMMVGIMDSCGVCGWRIFFPNDFSPGRYLVRWVRVKGYG